MSHVLYLHERASPAAFQEAMQAFLTAGYHVSSAPAENRDGVSARLKKEEEIWIEWFTGDALSVSAVAIPSEKLRKEVSQVLSGTKIKEARIV